MPGLAELSTGQYTPPNRTDPSSWWRDYMVRRNPSFQDTGPLPTPAGPVAGPPLPGVAPGTGTPADPGAPVVVGSGGPEVLPPTAPGETIGGMHPLTWLELYRGVAPGSLGGPV